MFLNISILLIFSVWRNRVLASDFFLVHAFHWCLADRTNGHAHATELCPSVTLCIVAKRCVLEQKLLLTAYRKSYMRNWLVPKWMTLTFC